MERKGEERTETVRQIRGKTRFYWEIKFGKQPLREAVVRFRQEPIEEETCMSLCVGVCV